MWPALEPLLEALSHISSDSIDDQARKVLAYTLNLTPSWTPFEQEPNQCPNCGKPCENPKSPYCSNWCREQSSMVRQFRSNVLTGAILIEEKQAVYGQIIWWLLGGDYPRRLAMVPESGKRQTLKRTGGLCECGQFATTFDHIGSACNRPSNLRPVCPACARIREFMHPEILDKPANQAILNNIASRLTATNALLICDDAASWNWREFLKSRTQ